MKRQRLTPFILVAVLGLGSGLGVGLGLGLSSTSAPALADYRIGPIGHEMSISAAPGQRLKPTGSPSVGSLLPSATGMSYELALPGDGNADVSILVSPTPIPKALGRSIINEFNNIPEHRTTWHGLPADIGVIPCVTPSGPCPGFQGGFTVLVDRTFYNVFVFSMDRQTAMQVVESVRISPEPLGAVSSAIPAG